MLCELDWLNFQYYLLYESECWLGYDNYKFRDIEKSITCVHIEEISSTDESKITEWYLLINLSIDNFEKRRMLLKKTKKNTLHPCICVCNARHTKRASRRPHQL